ncbi:MAG: hypothetical protein V4726_21590 [Verrucomicrobiota bacterium]
MPITGPASYVPTMDEFIAHWTNANTAAAPGVVVVAPQQPNEPAVTLAAMEALRGQLTAERKAVVTGLNQQHVAREKAQMQKRALLERYEQFAATLRAFFAKTPFLSSLPLKPLETELPARFLDVMEEMLSLWTQIEDAPPPAGIDLPLVLKGGFDITFLQDGIALLRTLLINLAQKEQNTHLARTRRNQMQEKIYPILRDYRLAVPAILGKNSPLTLSLPRLSPLPGKTPTGVSASGTFTTPENEARIVHTLSPDDDISHYELRQCPPPDYAGDDETIIASHPAGAPPEFRTQAGLVVPGDRSLFKVVTINDDGREKSSNTVDITWPTG